MVSLKEVEKEYEKMYGKEKLAEMKKRGVTLWHIGDPFIGDTAPFYSYEYRKFSEYSFFDWICFVIDLIPLVLLITFLLSIFL